MGQVTLKKISLSLKKCLSVFKIEKMIYHVASLTVSPNFIKQIPKLAAVIFSMYMKNDPCSSTEVEKQTFFLPQAAQRSYLTQPYLNSFLSFKNLSDIFTEINRLCVKKVSCCKLLVLKTDELLTWSDHNTLCKDKKVLSSSTGHSNISFNSIYPYFVYCRGSWREL